MILPQPLYAQRILLRTLMPSDIGERYLSWMQDDQIQKYLESRFQKHTEETLCAYAKACNDRPDTLLLAIEECSDNCHIGNIKLGPISEHHQTASIGILIGDKSRWGKGYASEAIARLADHATNQLGLRKLTAGCYAQNQGSIRAFQCAGFVQEAVLTAHAVFEKQRMDVVVLARHL